MCVYACVCVSDCICKVIQINLHILLVLLRSPFKLSQFCISYERRVIHSLYLQRKTDWFIDSNGKSTRLGLFYAYMLGKRVHYTFIYIFLCSCFLRVFSFLFFFCTIEFEKFSNKSIWAIDWDLSGTTTPVQSELGSNGNEEVLYPHLRFRIGAWLSDAALYSWHPLWGRKFYRFARNK